MLRSLYSGVAGLKSHQTRMDVIGNNIANVNTTGYKKSRVNFYDTLYQVSKGSSAPTSSRGGVNAQAVGLGTTIASIDVITTAGGTQTTNKMSDLMIQGNGYFILKGDSTDKYYTRAGNFEFDSTGKFVNTSNGMQVMGFMFDSANNMFSNAMTTINISNLKSLNPLATTGLYLEKNLDASAVQGDNGHVITQKVYDSLGREHQLVFTIDKQDATNTLTPTAVVQNDAANTLGWTNAAGVSDPTDYEYSLDGGNTWTDCTANPQTIPDQAYAIGQVQVRIKADTENGVAASAALVSTAAYTQNGATGAGAPASITVNDAANTFTWANEGTATYTDNADYEYSLDSGRTWTTCPAASRVISVGDVNIAASAIRVRVRQDANGAGVPANAGTTLLATTGFTSIANPTPATLPTVAANTWRVDLSLDGTTITPTGGNLYLTFDTSGKFLGVQQNNAGTWTTAAETFNLTNLNYGPPANAGNITLDFANLTQYAEESTAWADKIDADHPEAKGYPSGSLDSYTIDQSGIITGVYSNGQTRQLAQLSSATFENPAGLKQMGQNLFQVTNNSGAADEGKVGTGSRGEVSPGTLEMSNVDLSEEFTNMITTQRGFQANSRIITTSDQMLEELLSLKR